MSDLLSPIYVVFDCDEAESFWGLVGVMRMMVSPFSSSNATSLIRQESNFLRDQSGMKRQLSTLQQLIGVMDPELYAHLGKSTICVKAEKHAEGGRSDRLAEPILLLPVDIDSLQAGIQVCRRYPPMGGELVLVSNTARVDES